MYSSGGTHEQMNSKKRCENKPQTYPFAQSLFGTRPHCQKRNFRCANHCDVNSAADCGLSWVSSRGSVAKLMLKRFDKDFYLRQCVQQENYHADRIKRQHPVPRATSAAWNVYVTKESNTSTDFDFVQRHASLQVAVHPSAGDVVRPD